MYSDPRKGDIATSYVPLLHYWNNQSDESPVFPFAQRVKGSGNRRTGFNISLDLARSSTTVDPDILFLDQPRLTEYRRARLSTRWSRTSPRRWAYARELGLKLQPKLLRDVFQGVYFENSTLRESTLDRPQNKLVHTQVHRRTASNPSANLTNVQSRR